MQTATQNIIGLIRNMKNLTEGFSRRDGIQRIDRWKDDTLFGAARRLVAKCMDEGTNDPDCLPGIEFDEPRRSLFLPRNRFRPGVLGNLLLRAGQLRRMA